MTKTGITRQAQPVSLAFLIKRPAKRRHHGGIVLTEPGRRKHDLGAASSGSGIHFGAQTGIGAYPTPDDYCFEPVALACGERLFDQHIANSFLKTRGDLFFNLRRQTVLFFKPEYRGVNRCFDPAETKIE